MDIDNWMLVQVETMLFSVRNHDTRPVLNPIVWIHDIASYASPDTACVVCRFVVPKIAQNCKWIYSLFEVILAVHFCLR